VSVEQHLREIRIAVHTQLARTHGLWVSSKALTRWVVRYDDAAVWDRIRARNSGLLGWCWRKLHAFRS